MCQATVNVGCEHVGHGFDGDFSEGRDMTRESLLVNGRKDSPVHTIQGVDQVQERVEVPREEGCGQGHPSHLPSGSFHIKSANICTSCSKFGSIFPYILVFI